MRQHLLPPASYSINGGQVGDVTDRSSPHESVDAAARRRRSMSADRNPHERWKGPPFDRSERRPSLRALPPFGGFADARATAADRRAYERALLPFDRATDAGAVAAVDPAIISADLVFERRGRRS